MNKKFGKKVKSIIDDYNKTNIIPDEDLLLIIDWYSNLIDFFDQHSPLLTGLIVERRGYENIAFARGWDLDSY